MNILRIFLEYYECKMKNCIKLYIEQSEIHRFLFYQETEFGVCNEHETPV